MNTISLTGNLGKDNELKFLQDGNAVLNNSLAVRRNRKNQQGEYETDWFNISFFGKGAQAFAEYTQKGSKVGIVGRLEFRKYENNQGQNVTTHDVRVTDFDLLEPKGNSQNNGVSGNQQSNYVNGQQNQYNNQNQGYGSNNQQYGQGQPQQNNYDYNKDSRMLEGGTPVDVSSDDLPF